MQLTQDQQAATAAFSVFLTTDEKEMVLSGGAGVGKTTLLKHFMTLQEPHQINKLIGAPDIDEWHLTATTNKAAEVLSTSSGYPTSTIHSFLGLTVYNDYETGKTKITKNKKFSIKRNSVIVVDEASMIDQKLRSFIDEATVDCKILYVGDHCQLAPVGETISPVFVDVPNRVYLNQIVRSQNTPAITALAQQLRRTVETGVFEPIQEVPGTIDYLDPTQAQKAIDHYFVDHPEMADHARILAFTNNKVVGFNNYIRSRRGLPPEFIVGDKVVACNAAVSHYGKERLRVEQELTILKVSSKPELFPLPNVTDFEVNKVETDAGTFLTPVQRSHWQALIKHFKKIQDWPNYYALQELIADLRPRDASTVHKAQGSTHHTAFIDLSDIGTCRIPNQVARLLYVACSRPTDRICFIGRLPAKYGG